MFRLLPCRRRTSPDWIDTVDFVPAIRLHGEPETHRHSPHQRRPHDGVTLVGVGNGTMPQSAYRKLQPFGQIPAIEDGDLALFQSGAIVLYVAERSDRLLPTDRAGGSRVKQWMFAAINTMEPAIEQLAGIDLFYAAERWAQERRPGVVEMVRRRLGELASCLDGRNHLVGSFSAADILMTSVLRVLRHTDLLQEQPALVAYKERCEARPAFAKALADQMAAFAASATPA
jgi:glutathione S-transferase